MFTRCFGQLGTAQHTSHFLGSLVPTDGSDSRPAPSRDSLFFDHVVMVCKGGNLRQVGHAEHLIGSGQALEFLAHGLRRPAANACVDFVEYQRSLLSRTRLLARRRFRTRLKRQHHPG